MRIKRSQLARIVREELLRVSERLEPGQGGKTTLPSTTLSDYEVQHIGTATDGEDEEGEESNYNQGSGANLTGDIILAGDSQMVGALGRALTSRMGINRTFAKGGRNR